MGDYEEKHSDLNSNNKSGKISPVTIKKVVKIIKHHYQPCAGGYSLKINFSDKMLSIPEKGSIDVEWGYGHAAYLSFLRIIIDGGNVSIEHIEFRGLAFAQKVTVRRILTTKQIIQSWLDAIRVLSSIYLQKIDLIPGPGGWGSGCGWGASTDFFNLVRVMDDNNRIIFKKDYAGYESNNEQFEYLPLLSVIKLISESLDGIKGWEISNVKEYRSSHFTDAFNLNRDIMLGKSYWWVMEDSVEALGFLGTVDALPTLKLILKNHPELLERQIVKIKKIIENPDCYLSGEPKILTD